MNLGTTILQRLKSGVNLSMAACIRPIRNPQKQFLAKKKSLLSNRIVEST